MMIQLHEDQHGQIRLNLSEPFPINGVKQDCVLAPTLFSIFFSMMLKQATDDLEDEDLSALGIAWMAAWSTSYQTAASPHEDL